MPQRIALLLALSFGLLGQTAPNSAAKKDTPPPTVKKVTQGPSIKARTPDPSVKRDEQGAFYVAGYSVRTNNAKEMSGKGEIANLWQRFIEQDLGSAIPNRTDPTIYVVYSDYDSNEKGDYTYTLGARVYAADVLPANMTSQSIVPGTYAVVTTAKGQAGQVVQAAWKKIWTMTPRQMGGKRAFKTDFEVYGPRATDPRDAQVDIHIGLAPPPPSPSPAAK